jgi:branched-subunit amino acid ABC-type transport system permease component
MAVRAAHAEAELIDTVCSRVREGLPGEQCSACESFVRQYYHRVPAEDLVTRDPLDLYGAVVAHWNLAQQRTLGQAKVQTVSLAWRVASTVGLLLVIVAGIDLIYGTETTREVPVFLGAKNFNLFGTNVQESQAITFLFAVAVTVVLTIFFRVARRGKAMRAVVDNPELLDIAGTSPTNTRRLAWIIGMTLAAASGVLFAPVEQLDPVQLTLLVVSAFGAAAIGGFTSMPVTLAGGLGIGVLSSLCTKWFTSGFLSTLSVGMPEVRIRDQRPGHADEVGSGGERGPGSAGRDHGGDQQLEVAVRFQHHAGVAQRISLCGVGDAVEDERLAGSSWYRRRRMYGFPRTAARRSRSTARSSPTPYDQHPATDAGRPSPSTRKKFVRSIARTTDEPRGAEGALNSREFGEGSTTRACWVAARSGFDESV